MRPSRRDLAMPCVLILLVTVPMGCDTSERDDLPRESISGTVNFDGQPLSKGTIQFRPSNPAEGTGSVGMIDDGHFNIPRNDGPVPGKYKVQIDVRDDTGSSLPPGELPGAIRVPKKRPAALIPSRYNSKTELVEEVKPGGPNSFTFNLKK